ncbi:hypothetical protein Cni_G13379 [Canna indica]|uniref:Uncharacterized protein n=1 Tax=Canna indica TaxID=4628 RepID=A0AAQ3K9R6_9LILI|nr:hypothetical protein Cni_G13379 [Canna indica]
MVLLAEQEHPGINVDEFDRVMCINVRGTTLGTKHAARAMLPQYAGCIISIVSIAGRLSPHAYTMSKHAVVGLMKNAQRTKEEEDNEIEFLASSPTVREVEKTEEMVRGLVNLKGATLTARDVAEATLYLASDEAKYPANLVWKVGSLRPECVGFAVVEALLVDKNRKFIYVDMAIERNNKEGGEKAQ